MTKKEVWEIDLDQVTLNDLVLLEKGMEGLRKPSEVRDLLGRLVKNKTAEEIGEIPLSELWGHLDTVTEAIKETVSKTNDTPS